MPPRTIYRTFAKEIAAWSVAPTKASAAKTLLQQTLDMTAPPPPPSAAPVAVDSVSPVNATLRTALREQFRAAAKRTRDKAHAEQQLRDAAEILGYLRSQRTYKMLLDRYNPTATLEDHERIRLTARRVGLELPQDIQDRIEADRESAEADTAEPPVDKKS
ncbi:uncharacterized protein V1518DRAFT_419590 [Limtongia smithiae]|uniref:uncharacterized protein n=1 Tax=Limtongia smithiae TaxID=1125753 RepID=UPI0034CD3A95